MGEKTVQSRNALSYRPEFTYKSLSPYHTAPYHTAPYHTAPYHTAPYHTAPYHTAANSSTQYPIITHHAYRHVSRTSYTNSMQLYIYRLNILHTHSQ
uniref:Uncharacterized protein n=1 Tax=Octopus bimaculoides TaxID=37653 RepID=A0A0L8IGC4_OCTBM